MKLLKVYRTEQDLVIETSEGNRYCRLFAGRWINIDDLEKQCQELIGCNVITTAKWGYSEDYYFGEIRKDASLNNEIESEADENIKEINNKKVKQAKFPEKQRSVRRVFGPPGTGKTTEMMNAIKKRLEEGVKPQEIAFVSFTNVAANEAKDRIADSFPDYEKDDFVYFRTLHSLASKVGAIGGKRIMSNKHMSNFDRTITTKSTWTSKGIAESIKIRDEHPCLSLKSLANARKSTIKENFLEAMGPTERMQEDSFETILFSFKNNGWEMPANWRSEQGPDYFILAKEWLRLYEDYKERYNLLDFDDMISAMLSPNFDISKIRFKLFILDEAQDTSDALWDFAKLIISQSKESIVCGDDDQAIMEGFGASPRAFLKLPVTEEDQILSTSYRLPTSVKKALDNGPGKRLKDRTTRKPKEFKTLPNAKKGLITKMIDSIIDGKKVTKSFQLFNLVQEVKDKDIHGSWLIMSPTNVSVEFISHLFLDNGIAHFCKNEPITIGKEKTVSRDIRVQTIHTSKGSEADNVAIVLRTNGDTMQYDRSDTLAYVAESRTKDRMYFIKKIS